MQYLQNILQYQKITWNTLKIHKIAWRYLEHKMVYLHIYIK